MKKTIFTLMTLVALLMCGCEQGPDNPGGNGGNGNNNPDETSIDITPYLGKYLMSRHTELSINVLGMFSFPLDKDLDVEMVTVKPDPAVENGVIISNNDALYLHGIVDIDGLHLENDTVNMVIDTTIGNYPINFGVSVSMSHPTIQPPVDGIMEWTSIASGSASSTVLGIPINAVLTGDMRYKTILSH